MDARESGLFGACDPVLMKCLSGRHADLAACHHAAAATYAALLALAERTDEGSSILAHELGADGRSGVSS